MAGKTISEFTDAGALQGSDYFLIDRGSSTLKVSGSTVTNSITSSASGAFASKTDLTSLSSTVDANFALKTSITSLSSTVDTNFIPKPASASAQQVLTYNGSTTTWVASAAPNGSTGPTSAKAWVNFNGSTTSPVISASYNVSSITRYDGSAYNSTAGGNVYKINFTTPMTDVNYIVAGTSNKTTGAGSTSWVIMDYTQSPVLPVVPGISTGYVVVGLHISGQNTVTNQAINNIVIFGN